MLEAFTTDNRKDQWERDGAEAGAGNLRSFPHFLALKMLAPKDSWSRFVPSPGGKKSSGNGGRPIFVPPGDLVLALQTSAAPPGGAPVHTAMYCDDRCGSGLHSVPI